MSKTLAEHAAYELTLAGLTNDEEAETRQVAINLMALVRRFEKQKNNEAQTNFIATAFPRLISHLPLTALTDNPKEWEKFEMQRTNIETKEVETKVAWQSRRAPSIFSYDEGKTWVDQETGKTGECLNYEAMIEQRDKERAAAAERRKNANNPPKHPVGHVEPSVPAEEMTLGEQAETAKEEAATEETK